MVNNSKQLARVLVKTELASGLCKYPNVTSTDCFCSVNLPMISFHRDFDVHLDNIGVDCGVMLPFQIQNVQFLCNIISLSVTVAKEQP